MKILSSLSRLVASLAVILSTCLRTNAQTVIIYAPVTLVDGSTPGYYNASLGTILDGTAPQFPLPLGAGGGDPLIYPSDEPNLSAATTILGNWLTPHAVLNPTNWLNAPTIPATWAGNTETAIIYEIDGGTHGITNLIGNFDADNGLFVWVNGQFKFGARGPGLPSPAGQFEYTNVFLGNLNAGTNRIQILREDNFDATGYQVRIIGQPLGGTVFPACATASSSLIGWWRAEFGGMDSAGTNAGILLGGTGIVTGKVGQAFTFDGADDSVRIPVSGPLTILDVGINNGFTIEAWVNPSRLTIGPIAEWNNGAGGEGAHFWHSVDSIAAGDGPGNLYGNIVDTSGVSHQLVSPSGLLAMNTYNHVALTYDKNTGVGVIYANGVAVKTQNLGIFTPQTSFDFHIGRRPSGFFSENLFQGSIDEVSLYNSALTGAEIQAIYNASSNGKCVTNPPVVGCTPAPSGLVNWWQGEGNTTDNSGNISGGLYGGTTFASGKVGQAFSFDGINDCVTNSVWGLTNIVDSYTMEFWAMPTAARAVTGENTVGTDGHGNQRYAIFPYPGPEGGILGAGISVGTNGVSVVEHGPAYIPTLLVYNGPIIGWNHIAVVYSNRQPNLYINGVFVRSGLTSLNPSCPSTWLGERGDASVNQGFYAGLLDEVSIYNRSLSASEVQSIYNASSAGKCAGTNPPVVNCAPAPTGMVSWWRADGNGLDSADGNNGTLINVATITAGKVGQSFGFNGTNSYVNIPSSAALKPTGSLTFEAWIKYSGNPGAVSSYCIAAKGIDAEAAMDWALTVSANNRLRPHVNVNGSWQYFDCATSLSADTWYHVAMIYDGQQLQGYVNGSLDGSANVTGSLRTSDAPLRIGAYAPVNGAGSKAFFTGSIDEAAFYNRNLTIGELLAIFNAGSAGKCSPSLAFNPADGLIAHYPFSGDASDVSGNENHGTPSNAVLAVDRFGSPNAAFSFNGQNAAITVTDNPALRGLTSNYTFNAWVRFGSNPQIDAAILMKSAGAGDQHKWTFWRHVQASPYGIGLLLNRAPSGLFQWNNDYSFTTNQWFMVTFSASSANTLIAVDGQVVAAQSGNLVLPDTTGFAMSIGGAEPGGNQWFNGLLDDIRIYNRTFSSNDIAQLYQLESSPPPSTVAAVPVITSFNPTVATVGSSVTVFGTNFSPVASNNIVYFGAVRAGVTAASAISLTVTVPAGATHAPITATVGKLTAASPTAFLPSFVGNGSNITANSFAPGQNLNVADGPLRTVIADMDSDGKPDLVEANAYAHNISLFRNISVTGTLDGSSFAPRVDFPTLGGTDSPRCMTVADVDGDGKLDVLVGDQATSSVLVYRNIATPGTLTAGSLAAPVSFAAGSYPHGLRVADLDGDGLPEILVANHSGNSISILRNLGTAGSLATNSFAPQYALATGANPTDIAIADFNGDGKPDLVTTAFGGSQLSVFRNVFTPGAAVNNWFTLDTTLPALAGSLEFAVADMDGDAKSDLVVASVHGYAVSVYRNQAGAGAFSSNSFAARVDFGAPGWVHNVVVGDFNGDAKPDLALTGELNSYMAVFQNQSTPGSFTTGSLAARVDYATGWNAWGVAAGDLDGDNRADIVFANTYDDTLTFYRNIIPFGEPTNPSNSCASVLTGLVSWWRAESNGLDSVVGNNGILLNGASFAAGEVNQAFSFDGVDDHFRVTDRPNLRMTDGLTIEGWFYPTIVGGDRALVSKWDAVIGPGQMSYSVALQSGRAYLAISSTGTGLDALVLSTNALPVNQWTHLAATYDGAVMRVYLNGVQENQLTFTGGIFPGTSDLGVGQNVGGTAVGSSAPFGAPYAGRIDELGIYNRALTVGEIASIYNSGSAGKCPLPPPPLITEHPQDKTVNAGATAQFSVAASGSPTLRYQWFFAGNAIGGATNASLAIANAQPVHQGIYHATVSNDFGFAISSNATLTVLTFPPVITRQPTNLTVIVGSTTNLSVQATGSVTLAYQWLSNGIPMLGRTGTTLTFQNVQFSSAANYSVIVTNPYGAVTSSVAVLTVNPIPPCAPVHDGLVSWWKGENNAIDNWDSNNGTSLFSLRYLTGKVGMAFSSPFISVNDSLSLRVTNGLTIEAWINPSSLTSTRVILSKFEYPLGQPFGTQSAYMLGTTNNGALFFTLTPNGSVRTNTTLVTTNLIPLNQWTHVAATYDGSVMRLYINGSQIGQTNYAGKIFSGSAPLGIGGFSMGTSSPWQYSGLMDEVSLYNRALSAAEIQSIVAADLTGKCLAPPVITQQPLDQIVPLGEDVKFTVGVSGSRPLTYQWYLNGFGPQYRVPSATNATLIIEKVRTNNVGTYFVTVSNSVGSDFSVRVQLSTLPAPSCVDVLPGLISWWPGDANTLDAMGLNNILQYTPVSYPTGKVASAFTFNGIQSRIQVINSASLNFTNNQNFSIEMWIKATNSPAQASQQFPNVPLLEKRDSFSTGWLGYSLSLNNGKLAFALGALKSPAGGTTNQMFISSSPDLRDGMFHHVAVTLNRTDANGGVLYVDGAPVLVFDPRSHTNSLVNQQSLFIGAPITTFSNSYFTGLIDEPAIYNRALTGAEILSIRNAGAAGRCKAKPDITTQPANTNGLAGQNIALSVQATGTPLLRYQWRRNNALLFGATNATYNITNLSTANIGTYSVVVSNGFGQAISSNAVVAFANTPPIAFPGVASGFEDSQIRILMQGIDPDNQQPIQALLYYVISGPTNGVLTGATNSFLRTYIPNPNFFGTDFFTFVVNDGITNSTNATFTITVRPVNDAPIAFSEQFDLDEDNILPIQLRADDVDDDKLAFEIVQQPAHGVLTSNNPLGPKWIYTPETNYFGDDYFTFIARDGSNAVSQLAAVSIVVRPINDAPEAKIVIDPLDELPGVTNTVLIAPACCDATLLLDGSQSTDVENDALTYVWLDGTNVISTVATVTNRFRPGTHNITLVVSDGITADMETMIVEIITPSEAVDFLKSFVEDSITERRLRSPLVAWLRGAEESFERCHVELGVRFLEMFQQRVRERISPNHAELVQQLVDTTQAIIDAAPDCDPCHRIGRKNKRGHGDHDERGRDREERRDSPEVRVGKSSPR